MDWMMVMPTLLARCRDAPQFHRFTKLEETSPCKVGDSFNGVPVSACIGQQVFHEAGHARLKGSVARRLAGLPCTVLRVYPGSLVSRLGVVTSVIARLS
jgi:hypothetical protein